MKSIVSLAKKAFIKPLSWFKRTSWKKKIIAIVIVIIVISLMSSLLARITTPSPYTFATVQRGDIVEVVNETGSISTSGNIPVYSPTNGIVREIYVTNGDVIVEGQDLFIIESSATQQEEQTAYANYLSAVSSLNTARSNLNTLRAAMYGAWDSYRNLATDDKYENGDGNPDEQARESAEFQISQDEWEAAEAKYKDQQTVVGQASAQVSATWLAYQATQNATVQAPIGGTATNLSVAPGGTIRATTPTNPATPLLTIANLATTEIEVSLSETDIAKIQQGQPAVVDISAVDDKMYDGIVRRVDLIGTDVQGVIRYNVYIEILDPDNDLRPGMTADVEITTNTLENVMSVPNAAVKPYQGGRAVRVIENGELTYIPVEIGIRGEARTQILSGLTEGQQVVTSVSNEQIARPGLF